MMKVHVIGGFLGAGKTSLVRQLAHQLGARGEKVAVITNDQGTALVDTSMVRTVADQVREITGGCFCCRFEDLEEALTGAEKSGATVAVAEAVGSCTDLVATVIAPLCERFPQRFEVAPLAIVVDPWRVKQLEAEGLHADIAYLFRKQIEEADVVLLSRSDLAPPDVTGTVRQIRADAPIVPVSGKTGDGIGAWMETRVERLAAPLQIDYDRYAAAEAMLGWCNARIRLRSAVPLSPAAVMRGFLERMADSPVAHLKLTSLSPQGGGAAIVRAGDPPSVDATGLPESLTEWEWLVNARVELPPAELVARLRLALDGAAPGAEVEWSELQAFQPSRPTPQHRYALRGGAPSAESEAACCAAFYERADVRALLGDSWHPGGVELTLSMADKLGLGEGARLLDVACGQGTSLRAVVERFPVEGTGIDARPPVAGEAEAEARRLVWKRGDAHRLEFEDESFDAILCECAVSTFFDQPGALAEMRRVLKKGGRLAVSDMCIESALPESLQEWVHTGTCLARAMAARNYAQLLRDAGFRVVDQWDASGGLRDLLKRVKRNLVGAAFAGVTGQMPEGLRIDMKYARDVLREADAAIDARKVGYTAIIVEK